MKAKYVNYFLRVTVLGYLVLAFYYFLSKPVGGGDEALFLADLQLISSEGWIAAIKKGISIPYMLLTYPLSQLVEPYIALRGVNLLLFAGLVMYFFRIRKIKDLDFYALLFFFFCTVGYFMSGTNDTIFIVSLVIFLVESHHILTNANKSSLLWWGIGAVVALFTRELIILFAPVILLSLFFILKKKKARLRTLSVPLVLGALMIVLNLPSLSENGTLSYDKKLPPKSTNATWSQRQYYAQLLVNQGKLANYNHPGWKQTQQYLDKHGKDSLPRSFSESMFFDPALTIKEFFKDFIYIVLYGSRQLGLILAIILFYALRTVIKDRKWHVHLFLPSAVFIMMCIFALIIISFVELRWLAPVFIGSIVYFYFLNYEAKIPRLWVQANYLITALLSLYGMYGMITKL